MPLMLCRRYILTFLSALLIAPLFGCSASPQHPPNAYQMQQTHEVREVQDRHADVGCAASNIQSDMLSQVNRVRDAGAVCGGVPYPRAAPLRWSTRLQQAAAAHSQDMATHNFFNHKSATNGTTMPERLRAVGYRYQSAGENIGAGPATVAQVVDMWVASPGHCVILMTANFAELGASCKNNSHSYYKTYWTLKAATPG
jgi:uncharacterized protein YkwD